MATAVEDGGLALLIQAWPSVAADGWSLAARADGGPRAVVGRRPWRSARLATEAAVVHLARCFG